MKFRRVGPASLLVTIVIVVASLVGIGGGLATRVVERTKAAHQRMMQAVLASTLRSAEAKAVERASLVVSIPSVRTAFLKRDRAALAAECAPMFKLQDERHGVHTAQFHTPPGVSFLRLHEPSAYGDDQTGYRPILTDVTENRAIRKGIALSRSGPSIYGIVPILDDSGGYAGSFEMGLELGPVLDDMHAQYGIEIFALIDETLLRKIATGLPSDVLSAENRTGRLLRVHATRPSAARQLLTDRDVEVRDPVEYERRAEGKTWSVQVVPMYDYAGKSIGVFALAQDLTAIEAQATRLRLWQLGSALVVVLLLSAIVVMSIRKLVVEPVAVLARQMTALAAGDRSIPAHPEAYDEELAVFASGYEALREQK